MVHAAPRNRGMIEQGRTTDVFDARTHRVARIVLPVLAALVYGFWAAANRRYGGPVTGWNLLFGFLTALAFAVLYVAVRAIAQRLSRELHAVAWAAFAGIAFGFLYSQTDASVLESTVLSLVIGAALFAVLFYRYYTHEDAEGHRLS